MWQVLAWGNKNDFKFSNLKTYVYLVHLVLLLEKFLSTSQNTIGAYLKRDKS